jgi:hypothetical protein
MDVLLDAAVAVLLDTEVLLFCGETASGNPMALPVSICPKTGDATKDNVTRAAIATVIFL